MAKEAKSDFNGEVLQLTGGDSGQNACPVLGEWAGGGVRVAGWVIPLDRFIRA